MSGQKIEKTNEGAQVARSNVFVLTREGLSLPTEIKKVDAKSCSIWVRKLLQNWRQGTVACKDRSMVAFSNKKPWKQKGTGRARAGSLRSPLWRKGGVTFGPQPRVRKLKVSASLKKSVLGNILSDYLSNKKIFSLDFLFISE